MFGSDTFNLVCIVGLTILVHAGGICPQYQEQRTLKSASKSPIYTTTYTLPPIFRTTFLLNPPILGKTLLQTLLLILHIIQQLRKLMSPGPNSAYRRNLFRQYTTRLVYCILCVDFASVVIDDVDGAALSVATFENVRREGIKFGS